MRPLRRAAAIVAALGAAGAAAAAGQARADTLARARPRAWLRPVASLVVPGAGQLLARQDRAAGYLAVELYVLSRTIDLTREAHREGDQFRELAFRVAQRGFATTRRDTVFEYYETMERFDASGAFDLDPGPALAPETDPSTYNGSVWLLARRTFWANPDSAPPPTSPAYQRALAFYVAHAVGPAYEWSWRDAELERGAFRALIRSSDDAYRAAQNQLGLLVANHLLSALDALISSGLSGVAARPAELRTWVGGAHDMLVQVRVAF